MGGEHGRDPQLETLVESLATRWDAELRRAPNPAAGHRAVRAFLFEDLPAGTGGPSNDHAFVMFELIAWLTSSERIADAFDVLDWLAEMYARQSDPDIAVRSIMALTDWAVQLSAKDSDRARAVMRRSAELVPAHAHVAIQRAACRALTQVALLSTQVTRALEDKAIRSTMRPWREIVDRWAGSDDPELRGRLAQAQCNLGFIHLQLGEGRAARDWFARVAALPKRPGAIPGDFQEFLFTAENADRVLGAIDLPDRVELHTDYLMAQRRNDRRVRGRTLGIPWLLAGAPRNQANELIRIAQRRHRMSVGKVKVWSCAGEPFTLLLRNFDLVEWSRTSPELNEYGTPAPFEKTIHATRRGEELLGQLAHWVPMVQVASTVSAELDLHMSADMSATAFPRFVCEAQLYLSDETWLDTVKHLITLAETIVVWAEAMTPALGQELAAIRSRGRTRDTILLLEEVTTMPGAGRPRREQLTSDSPALAGFSQVIEVREFPEGDIDDHPSFVAMRRHHQELFSLSKADRIERLLSRLETAQKAP